MPNEASHWSQLAQADLDVAYNTIAQNHPGPVDPLNPGFVERMERDYANAKLELPDVTSEPLSQKHLSRFLGAFDDQHVRVYTPKNESLLPARDFSLTRLSSDLAWVRLPSCYTPRPGEGKMLETLMSSLPTVRDCSAVVFDLRGNGGGQLLIQRKVFDTLYGEEYIRQQVTRKIPEMALQWRSSPKNLEYYKKCSPVLGLVDAMQESADKDVSLTQPIAVYSPPSSVDVSPLSLARPVFITDKDCFSAALCFLDVGLQLPNALPLGQTTGADTQYTYVRYDTLPSGKKMMSPTAVWRNRPRGCNQPYVPAKTFLGEISDTPAVQKWVRDEIGM